MAVSRRAFLSSAAMMIATPYVARADVLPPDRELGQMLLLGFSGVGAEAKTAQHLARHITAGVVGGVLFLGHNFKTREGVESLTRLFRTAAREAKPFLALDQEGGSVQRLGARLGYPVFPAAQAVAARNDPAGAQALYTRLAREVRGAGFNLNMGPVVDVGSEPRNPVIAKFGRAYGEDGASIARYAGAFIAAHRDVGVLTALKHFPGHGSTLTDSHARSVDITPTWHEEELEPYAKLNRAGLIDIVMSGHLAHARHSLSEPATLSYAAITGVLREKIGFSGVVMTDDLDMAAIRSSYALEEAVVRAIAAGNDLIMLSNSASPNPDLPYAVLAAIKAAVAKGRLDARRLEASVERIGILKARMA